MPTTLHIVPHTHWDREWYLPFQEMRIKLVHLVDGLLDILARDPGYAHFTLDGQTIVVDDYLEVRPERRGELARHVAAGRLLVGPWTVLPDEFLVSPEALVRNLRLGRRAAEALAGPGAAMDVGYVPDPFGHVGQLPQILRGFGLRRAAFRRGLGDEPVELRWESPDGSRVLVAYLRDGYGNAARLPERAEAFAIAVRARGASLDPHSSVSHRLLLNGTDHQEPQAGLAALLAKADSGEDRWLHSTLPAYLDAVQAELDARGLELPVVRGELRDPSRHHLLPGVLSSRVWIKQRNDDCERELERWAEPFAAWAERACAGQLDASPWTGHLETPRVRGAAALLDRAWRLLLECHPHDSICGCSVDAVHDEMRARFDQSEQIAREVARQSLGALAREVDTRPLEPLGSRAALVVFNPGAARTAERARAQVELGPGLDPFEVVGADGEVLPHRVIGRSQRELFKLELAPDEVGRLARGLSDGRIVGLAVEAVDVARDGDAVAVEIVVSESGEPDLDAVGRALGALDAALPGAKVVRARAAFAPRVELEVAARDLPPHGYAALGLRPAESPGASTSDEGTSIANEWLRVEASPDGTLALTDLRSGATFAGLLRLRDRAERGDSYTTCPVDGDEPITKPNGAARIRREADAFGESLAVEIALEVPRRLAPDRASRAHETVPLPVTLRVSLAPGGRRADLEIQLDNTAEDHRLELLAPVGAPISHALYDGHYEVVRRPTQLPAGGADWQEQPACEQPMRHFVAARPDGEQGLAVAARGLREASVSPEGVIAVTLLRCFGWLSRDDLSTRAGGAGPALATPGGQCPGPQRFELSLIPFAGPLADLVAEADAFQTLARGTGTGLHQGTLPLRASLLETEPAELRLTSVHEAQDGTGVVARGVLLGDAPAEVRFRPHARPRSAERVRLDETQLEPIEPDADGWISVPARPAEIVSVRLRY